MEKVELRLAYLWDCPSCGREQVLRLVMTDSEQVDESNVTMQVTFQTPVTCRNCGAEYETTFLGEEE